MDKDKKTDSPTILNLGKTPLELAYSGPGAQLPVGITFANGKVTILPQQIIPQVVWNELPDATKEDLRLKGIVRRDAAA